MGHVDDQLSGSRGRRGPESDLRDAAFLIAKLGSKINLLREGISGTDVGRDVVVCAGTRTQLGLILFRSNKDTHDGDIAGGHDEIAVVHHRDHRSRVAGLIDIPGQQNAIRIGCCGQRDDIARMQSRGMIGANRAVFGLVKCDGETLGEDGGYGHIAVGHGEGVVVYRDGLVVGIHNLPSREEVAGASAGGQGDDIAHIRRGRIGTDGAAFRLDEGDSMAGEGLEVGDVATAGHHVEGVAGLGRNHGAVQGPIDEGVACVGRSSQGDRRALIVAACTGDGAALTRVGRGHDSVADAAEVGHVGGVFSGAEADAAVG